MQPRKWLLKWRTQISLSIAMHVGRAILDSLPNSDRNWRCGDICFSHADVLETSIGDRSSPFERPVEGNANDGITKACKYPEEKDSCTNNSARLEWPYPHSWYSISMIISLILVLAYARPLSRAAVIVMFYVATFIGANILGKRQVLGSYWCWAAAALAPLVLIVTSFMTKK